MKKCPRCKETKSKSEFNKNKSRKDGIGVYCRKCIEITYKEKRGLILEQKKEYYIENKEIILEDRKEYYIQNREIILDDKKEYHIKNKKKISERSRKHNQTLKGKFSRYKGDAKHRDIEFNLTIEEFTLFWRKPCSYCGDEIETIGIDRVDSSKGYFMENCVPCCEKCNRMKLNHSEEEWIFHMLKVLKFKNKI